MKNTRLILIEGIPGTGKTTISEYVRDLLIQIHIPCCLYEEGDLDHPADFESVACLDLQEFALAQEMYPQAKDSLKKHAVLKNENVFIPYRKMARPEGISFPDGLIKGISQKDVYNLPAEKFTALLVQRWQEFAARAEQESTVYIFECCFLQNPMTKLLACHHADPDQIFSHICLTAAAIAVLNPCLIYLDRGDVWASMQATARQRLPEWLDFVIRYTTGQAYGKSCGVAGFLGMVQFYQDLKAQQLRAVEKLEINKLVVDVSRDDWEKAKQHIAEFVV